jgi:hypothetical protein
MRTAWSGGGVRVHIGKSGLRVGGATGVGVSYAQLVAQRDIGCPDGGCGLAPQLHGAAAPAVLLLAVRLVRGGHFVEALQQQNRTPRYTHTLLRQLDLLSEAMLTVRPADLSRFLQLSSGKCWRRGMWSGACVYVGGGRAVSPPRGRGRGTASHVGVRAATSPCPPPSCGCSSCPRR